MLEIVCLIVSYLQCSFCNSFRQCIAHFYFIVMSTVPTTKWEANLHGANFWIHGCGGHSKVLQNTSLRIWMLELLYDKHCAPFDSTPLGLCKAICNFLLRYFELGCPLNHPHNYGQMLFDMTMQTPPLSAFAKPFAIFFFSISNLVAP